MNPLACDLEKCFMCNYCMSEWKELIAVKRKNLFFRKGEMIFREGDKVAGIFFLYSGAVKVHKQWNEEKELILRFASSGDILGHRGLAAGEFYPVSATALVDSTVCFINAEFLEATLSVNHALTYKLMQFYAGELLNAETKMRNLAAKEVKSRIAETLLEIQQVFGTDGNHFVTVPISRQDIAAYSGTTYETVFKCFKELIEAGVIRVSGKYIMINDENKLKSISRYAK